MLGEIPKTWRGGRRDDAARNELVRTLREVSELDAGRAVIDLLKGGVSTASIWEALFATAAELVLRRPSVVPVHAQTSANAFHYVFQHARAESTQLLALLQSAAFMPRFGRRVRNARPDLRIDALEPLAVPGNGADTLRDAFSELPHDRTAGARKALHYLQHGGSAERLIASARRQLARNGRHAHEYKFTEAALENYGEWRPPRGGTGFCPPRWHTSRGLQRCRAPLLKRRCSFLVRAQSDRMTSCPAAACSRHRLPRGLGAPPPHPGPLLPCAEKREDRQYRPRQK